MMSTKRKGIVSGVTKTTHTQRVTKRIHGTQHIIEHMAKAYYSDKGHRGKDVGRVWRNPYITMSCLTIRTHSGKCVITQFHCTNITEFTYTNLNGITYYTPRLYGI